ncbi:MAG: type II toxin-antitoxin system RelE/ParE family toxin [Bacteroidia bacterium]
MDYKLIVTERAVAELESACLYYNKQQASLGFELEEEIFILFEMIQENPLLFPVKFAHIHEAVVKRFPFVINYEVIGKKIIVLSLFHAKQNPRKKVKNKK